MCSTPHSLLADEVGHLLLSLMGISLNPQKRTWGIEEVQLASYPHPLEVARDARFRSAIAGAPLEQPIDERALAHIGEADDACADWAGTQPPSLALGVDLRADLRSRLRQLRGQKLRQTASQLAS